MATGLHSLSPSLGRLGVILSLSFGSVSCGSAPDLVTITGVSGISCSQTQPEPSPVWHCTATISGTSQNFDPATTLDRIEGSISLAGTGGLLVGTAQGGAANAGFQVQVETDASSCESSGGSGADASVSLIESHGSGSETRHTAILDVDLGISGC